MTKEMITARSAGAAPGGRDQMGKPSFTPGPWEWVDPTDDTDWDGDSIASLRTVECFGKDETKVIDGLHYSTRALPKFIIGYAEIVADEEEQLCNLRLIAAAPALYEALEYVIRDLKLRADLKRGEDKGLLDIGCGAIMQAEAALALVGREGGE